MIHSRANNIKSGWKSIFVVFGIASTVNDGNYPFFPIYPIILLSDILIIIYRIYCKISI